VLLPQQLLPSVVILVAKVHYRLEDGQTRLQLLSEQTALVVEGHVFEGFDLHGCQLLGLGFQTAYSAAYIFLSLARTSILSSISFLSKSKVKE